MENLLRTGEVINLPNKRKCTVEKFLGGGTQGEVYKVKIDKQNYALKWFYKTTATRELYKSLDEIVHKGAPTENFLWPLELVRLDSKKDSFGYIMSLRPPEYKSLSGFATMQFKMDFKGQIKACLELAESFHHLHSKGWSYQDISFGNVFINPDTGNILVCDNDNVTVTGKTTGNVMGTQRFMAPEIVTGHAKPSAATDQFSLAVLLFYILMMSHPLEGKKEAAIKCFDIPAMNKLYGEEPVFIFDPNDDSNRPVKGIHNNAIICWGIYPSFIKDLFIKAFTKGLKDSNMRIRESQWQEAFSRLLDSVFYCRYCGNENFYDDRTYERLGHTICCVPSCGKPIQRPAAIKINGKLIMLNKDTFIYEEHLSMGTGAGKKTGQVVQSPNNPKLWGIKNLTDETWTYTNTENQLSEVQPQRSALIRSGSKINFGKAIGEIV